MIVSAMPKDAAATPVIFNSELDIPLSLSTDRDLVSGLGFEGMMLVGGDDDDLPIQPDYWQ